ncbi:5-amino-6-(D-ribitylamino)uracil--L-tyrosine 4-hydroxyphenyl transferase CofH [Enterovirga sp.]|uniref:5-amino-6-(D-ribitylamino)uracil--L-tyrosine 4-hydroxyphenyl transferase CofH n=1 Tax=Enterovirga sp. TaxID=2026350 RepID=UPI0026306869|nr:5-amino-6-(D-ribitylamino)uracil--L-tyrosine 4-hydroxyphenyl transferase CofH [Enterovirga sp.]MDB5590557.1 7,8-didemethyl-8-hydroxy-5-deazariboflavin synthase subunit 1 [Enterovirga sp.]
MTIQALLGREPAAGRVLDRAVKGTQPSDAEALALAGFADLAPLMAAAAEIRDTGFGDLVTYSRKVFAPLTQLCRNVCHYCTFAQPPRNLAAPFLSPDEVVAIAEAGRERGCKEILFTLGDKPELRYGAAQEALTALGYATTLDYLASVAKLASDKTGLLPHLNPGVMDRAEIERLRPVAASMGLMLESTSDRLCGRGGVHFGSPDKDPRLRLASIAAAGEARVPFTSGILIGIGETRLERIEALLALRALHRRYGHIQEIIVQNFRAKAGTRMATAPEPSFADHLWTVAVARILFGPAMTIQAPPNLSAGALPQLVEAGINDWGGVSPVTIDHVNPEKPWPHLDRLEAETAAAGKVLAERLTAHPTYLADAERWLDPAMKPRALKLADADWLGRAGMWVPGAGAEPGVLERRSPSGARETSSRAALRRAIDRASDGQALSEGEIVQLFQARGDDYWTVCEAADRLRLAVSGSKVAYVVTRNINYTNVCYFRCQFCAFSKGKLSENLRGRPYDLELAEIAGRAREAWERGATEVCLQGGIHPSYTGQRYLDVLAAVKEAVPGIHVHAFSPLEIRQGAETLGMSLRDFLIRLRDAGLGSLPGTAAEILDDEIRQVICPDKLTTDQWLEVVRTAHEVGLPSTSTIMYGHVERPLHWARHLLRLRALASDTGGITEFVPLPFVPMETPIYLKGRSRAGATLREAVLMHAVGRLALNPVIRNIQTSWVKMGQPGAALCLASGANDLGGTLMDESISRAAGATHGQEMTPRRMESTILALGRRPVQRTTLYGEAPAERQRTARDSYEGRPEPAAAASCGSHAAA